MSPIRIVGVETLQSLERKDYNLANRLRALAGKGIMISHGICLALGKRGKEKTFLTGLLTHSELDRLGQRLTQEDLDRILNSIAQKLSALETNLNLAVKSEEGSIIIAFKDEIAAESGAMVLAARRMDDPSRGGDALALFSGAGGPSLAKEIQKLQGELAAGALRLPGISDPGEFERELRRLSPYMRGPDANTTFVELATRNFFERPALSRRVIAEVLKSHGLNWELLDSVATLNSDFNSDLKIEAINSLVTQIPRLEDPIEAMFVAVSLLKVMEEESDKRVKGHALSRMAQNIEALNSHFPNLLETGKILPMLKKLIIIDPAAYRAGAERLLAAFGRNTPIEILRIIEGEVETITNPYVRLAYYNVMEELETDPASKNAVLRQKWTLCCESKEAHPDIADEIEAKLKAVRAQSIPRVIGIFNQLLTVDEKIEAITFLDEMFEASLPQIRDVRAELQNCKIIIDFFILLTLPKHQELHLALLSTRAVHSPAIPEQAQGTFWPLIEANFSTLSANPNFVERFIASGQLYYAHFSFYLASIKDPGIKHGMLTLACRKSHNVDPVRLEKLSPDQREFLASAHTQIIDANLALISTAPGEIDRNQLFAGVATLAKSPFTTSAAVLRTFGEVRRKGAENTDWSAPAQRTIISLASHPSLRDDELTLFIDEYTGMVNRNTPAIPSAYASGDAPATLAAAGISIANERLLTLAIDGLASIIDNPKLSQPQQERIIQFLVRKAFPRKPKSAGFVKGQTEAPPPPADPFRDKLLVALRRIQSSSNLPVAVKEPLSRIIENL